MKLINRTNKNINIHSQQDEACWETRPLRMRKALRGVVAGFWAQSYAGSLKSCGSNSSMLLRRSVASWVRLGSRLSSGIITTCMPAASAAFTPLGASSNAKHWTGQDRKHYPVTATLQTQETFHSEERSVCFLSFTLHFNLLSVHLLA